MKQIPVLSLTLLLLWACALKDGKDGSNGKSCTVEQSQSGETIIRCEDGTIAIVRNGLDGQDGKNGTDGADGKDGKDGTDGVNGTIVETITLCPHIIRPYPEIMLKMNGKYYAVYAQGQKIFLTEVTPGTYTTTDGANCKFTVHNDMSITYE